MASWKVNSKLIPIKAHYFFFMASMGPILPQLTVFGREMGISPLVMGTVTGIVPLIFLLAKPIFGMIVDVYRNYRKAIFMGIILMMSISYGLFYIIPSRSINIFEKTFMCEEAALCNISTIQVKSCDNTKGITCYCSGYPDYKFIGFLENYNDTENDIQVCSEKYPIFCNVTCNLHCTEDVEIHNSCLYSTPEFWMFVIFMAIGTICFNVTNSLSDAICFDVIGLDNDYGKQRVWGTIGFGTTAFISGYIVNHFSTNAISYKPAIICMLIFILFDLIACFKLKLPVIESPESIFKDLGRLLNNKDTIVFIFFSVCAGIVDGFIVFFLLWYIEDLALASGTTNIKLIEGLTVAAETLIGEVVFFYIGGLILERFGHTKTFTMCFIFYALRLGLISIVPNPWWILLIECFMQGPTYALTYTTIVAYANVIAPPGMSATLQGIAAGMDDGCGYAIGGILGGVIYKYLGGRHTFQIFSTFALICSLMHVVLHKTILKNYGDVHSNMKDVVYHVTEQSNLMNENVQKSLQTNLQKKPEELQTVGHHGPFPPFGVKEIDIQNVQKHEQVT